MRLGARSREARRNTAMQETPQEYIQRILAQLGRAGSAEGAGQHGGETWPPDPARVRREAAQAARPGKMVRREKSSRISRTAKLSRAGGCGRFWARPERRSRRLTRTPGPPPATMRSATRANRSSSFVCCAGSKPGAAEVPFARAMEAPRHARRAGRRDHRAHRSHDAGHDHQSLKQVERILAPKKS